MKRPLSLKVGTQILSRLVSERDREPLIGDLEEEYALRARIDPSSAPLLWYLRQICSSIPPVVAARLLGKAWLATLGVALVAYLAVGLGQVLIYFAIPASSAPTYDPLGVVVTFPMVVVIGYFAEKSRRRAAIVLGAMMLFAITAMTALTTENAPSWYLAAYFFIGPLGAVAGGAVRSRVVSR